MPTSAVRQGGRNRENTPMDFLFVYGTLLKPLRDINNISISEMTYIGTGFVCGDLYDLGDYPGLILPVAMDHEERPGKVFGEVYSLGVDYSFDDLDIYEEYFPENEAASEFVRMQVMVYRDVSSGENSLSAWVYVYNKSITGMTKIPGGDYLKFLNTRGG